MNKLTFSILLVGLFAAATLARNSPQIRRPFRFVPGQTYIYEYRGRQWNGIAELADQYSGLTIDCDVILKALPEVQGQEILMKLDDVKVEQLHTQALNNNDFRKLNQGHEVDQRQATMYKDELAKPIRFSYIDGKVVRFIAETSDPEWSINIKKSILSLFQLDLAPTKIIKSQMKQQLEQAYGYNTEDIIRETNEMPLVYPIYEESFGGICETLYEVNSADNVEQRDSKDFAASDMSDVLNVTKTVNYKNCLTDPSVSYDRHSFKLNTQTIKGKLFSKDPSILSVAGSQFNTVPEELKSKYSNVFTSFDSNTDNVASPVPVDRHSFTKYNITTAPPALAGRAPVASPADMSLIEGIYSESKIKYEANGDILLSDTQQSLKLITCAPTNELARVVPDASSLAIVNVRQPAVEYHTIQCELNSQKLKFYQALWKVAQVQSSLRQSSASSSSQLYSHQMSLPFALSASWYPVVATGEQSPEQSIERSIEPDQLAKSYENLLISLADDILTDDVAQSKRAGEKVVRLINIVAFMPRYKLAEVYDRVVAHIQTAKQQQAMSRGKQAIVDNQEVSKWKIVRKLCLDTLPLAGSKQAIEMIELLIESNRVKPFEARELCESVPANLRYPDTEIIDAFVRVSQLAQVRRSRATFASCSIAVGKMIAQASAKSNDASYKPTTYEPYTKLPANLRDDEIVKQVVQEADPRRQLPINWNSADQQELYERLVLDQQDITKYVKLYKQFLSKATRHHEKVIYLETLAHMKVPEVLPILEPFATGRLSLAQCLGSQPLDIAAEPTAYGQQQRRQQQLYGANADSKDWDETDAINAEECNYMRTVAIYAMAHVARWAPNKVQALLLPVFDNTYEPYQIRIAAFTTMSVSTIDDYILERIASQMWREPNKEVASFVVGTIDTISKMTNPQMRKYIHAAKKAAESMPKQYLDTFKHSWMAGGDHYDQDKQTGSIWLAELIKSNVSSIPRAAYFHLGRQHGVAGSKFDNTLELGFTAKGLETLIKDYIEFNKDKAASDKNIVASIFENLYSAKDDIVRYYLEARDSLKASMLGDSQQKLLRANEPFAQNFFFKRQQPIDGVNTKQGKQARQTSDMFEGMARNKRSITIQARKSTDDDEEAKLTLFAKLFDQTRYHALDKRALLQMFESFDDYLKMAADELIMGNKLHYVKLMMPSNMWHVVPSQMGLPVVVTHRKPIIVSLKVDGSQNGQLTSNKASQYLRKDATQQQVPNTLGQNFATMAGLNITALIHPKIMHSDMRFMFAVEQANQDTFGCQTEKSHQISLPMELSIAYSQPKELVSLTIQPKTPSRIIWTKETAKTFIAKLALGGSQPDQSNWLGQEHLIRVPSKSAQYKRQQRPESFVPSLVASLQGLLNQPKESQTAAIEELETPYKFEHRFLQQALGLELYLEGATDDEDVVQCMGKPELVKKSTLANGQLQWTATDKQDNLEQHTKSGPFNQYVHLFESAKNRQSKYLEFYTTMKPQHSSSPVYRFDFLLNNKENNSNKFKFNANKVYQATDAAHAARSWSRLDVQAQQQQQQQARMYDPVVLNKKLNQIGQPELVEVY